LRLTRALEGSFKNKKFMARRVAAMMRSLSQPR